MFNNLIPQYKRQFQKYRDKWDGVNRVGSHFCYDMYYYYYSYYYYCIACVYICTMTIAIP